MTEIQGLLRDERANCFRRALPDLAFVIMNYGHVSCNSTPQAHVSGLILSQLCRDLEPGTIESGLLVSIRFPSAGCLGLIDGARLVELHIEVRVRLMLIVIEDLDIDHLFRLVLGVQTLLLLRAESP